MHGVFFFKTTGGNNRALRKQHSIDRIVIHLRHSLSRLAINLQKTTRTPHTPFISTKAISPDRIYRDAAIADDWLTARRQDRTAGLAVVAVHVWLPAGYPAAG
jgi:hypothetical protein